MNKILKISTILSGVIFSLSSPLLVYADTSASIKQVQQEAASKNSSQAQEMKSEAQSKAQDEGKVSKEDYSFEDSVRIDTQEIQSKIPPDHTKGKMIGVTSAAKWGAENH